MDIYPKGQEPFLSMSDYLGNVKMKTIYILEKINTIISVSVKEIIILTTLFFANVLPDMFIFSIIRPYILKTIANIGYRTRIKKNIYINSFSKVTIGKNCFINRGVILDSLGNISIGNNVLIGFNTSITTATHSEKEKDNHSIIRNDITIGDNVWIGANVTILSGSEIGDNCIIGAGAVVRGKLKQNGVYAGIPARYIRDKKC